MSSWFGSIISSLTGSATPVPNFDFHFKLTEHDPDSVNWTSACGTNWTIRNGTKGSSSSSNTSSPASPTPPGGMNDEVTASSDDVSIFCCEVGKQSEEGLVRNVMKKARALMLPGVLRCLGTAEYQGQIFIATDRCTPLKTILSQKAENRFYKIDTSSSGSHNNSNSHEEDEDDSNVMKATPEEQFQVAVSFGMNTISSALSSLHKNRLFHGCVNIDSIFVLNESGEWRLFGFEYATSFDDVISKSSSFNRSASSVLLAHRIAPEAGGIGGASGSSSASGKFSESSLPLLDSWGLGILLLEVFHYHTSTGGASATLPTSANDLRSPRSIPRDFLSSYNVLVTANASLRWTPDRFHKEAEIIHGSMKIVRLMTDLDQLTLKDSADRDSYYRELATCVDTCPARLSTGLILPKIANLLQYGGCSAAALVPLLRIARKLSTEAFATKVAPSVLVMFNSNEPLIRMKLLEHAELYAPLLPEKLVCERIWPLYQQGLNSKIPEIRELSIRSLVHFAPVLTEKFNSGDIVKALLALQQDGQGVIRTNTTICLGMLARFLPSESRGKTLCNGFGRMLKDPYAPSRAAAVRSISSLAEETFSAQQICEQLLPALCPMLLDGDRASRDAATTCVQNLVKQGISLADQAVPCQATQPAMQHSHTSPSSSNTGHNRQSSTTSSSNNNKDTKPFSITPASNNSQVSTPTASSVTRNLGMPPKSNSAASLDITPIKSENPVTKSSASSTSSHFDAFGTSDLQQQPKSIITAQPKKPASGLSGFKKPTTATTTSTAPAAKSKLLTKGWEDNEDDEDDEDFSIAPSSATANTTITTTTFSTMSKVSSSAPKDASSLNSTTTSAALSSTTGGGGMKLGAVKKRGFGVKNN